MGRLLPPVALVLASAVLAGCGGGDTAGTLPEAPEDASAAYEEEVRAVNAAVFAASERLADDTADPAQLETELEEALRRLDQAAPPYDALPEHQRLSQALGQAVDAAAALAASGEPRPADVEQLRASLEEAEDALEDLEEKGYDVARRT